MAGGYAEFSDGLADAHVSIATGRWTAEELGEYYARVAEKLEDGVSARER